MSSNLGVIVKKRESSRYYRTFSHLAQREFPNRGLTNSQLYTKYSKCSDKNKHLTRRKRFLHLGAIGTALAASLLALRRSWMSAENWPQVIYVQQDRRSDNFITGGSNRSRTISITITTIAAAGGSSQNIAMSMRIVTLPYGRRDFNRELTNCQQLHKQYSKAARKKKIKK